MNEAPERIWNVAVAGADKPADYVRADLYEVAVNFVDEIRAQYKLLADAVNDHSGECKPECDSHGHAEDCEFLDMVYTLKLQQAQLARLREAVREWNKSHPWCDCEECDALRAAAEQGEPK